MGRSCARLESVVELCAGKVEGKREEGAEVPLVMFIDGDSVFGVEDADEAEREGVGKKSSLFVIDSKYQSPRKMAVGRHLQ